MDPCEQISVKFQLNCISFHRNYISKYRTQNGGHIVSDRYGYLSVTIWFSCGKLLTVPFYCATLMKRYFPGFLCAFICRYDATNGYRFTFSLGSRYVGHSSVLFRECVGRIHAIRCYVGLGSVFNRPWIGVRTADKFVCPNKTRHQTDKTESIPTVIPQSHRPNRHETDLKPTKILKFGERSVYSRYWFGFVGLMSVYVRAYSFVGERSFKHVWKISPRQIAGCLSVICRCGVGFVGERSRACRS